MTVLNNTTRALYSNYKEEEDTAAGGGIIILIGSLICLGTWPAVLRLASSNSSCSNTISNISTSIKNQNDEQQWEWDTTHNNTQRRRHPCHVYIDYSITYCIVSMIPMLFEASSLLLFRSDNDQEGSTNPQQQTQQQENENDKTITTLFFIPSLVLVSMVGGILLSLGNLSMQWSTSVFGCALTTVLAAQASLTVVIGTSINYLLQPTRTHHVQRLVVGVLLFLVAIVLAYQAQVRYSQDRDGDDNDYHPHRHHPQTMMSISTGNATDGRTMMRNGVVVEQSDIYTSHRGDIELEPASLHNIHQRQHHPHRHQHSELEPSTTSSPVTSTTTSSSSSNETTPMTSTTNNKHNGYSLSRSLENDSIAHHHTSTDVHHYDHSHNNQQHTYSRDTSRGLVVAVMGGICFGFFSPAFNIAINNPFDWGGGRSGGVSRNDDDDDANTTTTVALSVAAANWWFALAFSFCSVVVNIILMTYPPKSKWTGRDIVEPSSFQQYFYLSSSSSYFEGCCSFGWWLWNTINQRWLAIMAGGLCAMGNVLQFIGGDLAGFAAADLVQAFPLVATIWDIYIFGEFQKAMPRVIILLLCMYVSYLGGILFLAGSILE